jgi:LytS/YehU family sensor histidine kinase
MVLTLVENAVKHGLAPTRSGGRIDVRATRSDNALAIVVADTGQGFTATKGAGTGLANTRTRLRVCYGGAANLALTRNSPTGVIATLTFPYAWVAACSTRSVRCARSRGRTCVTRCCSASWRRRSRS